VAETMNLLPCPFCGAGETRVREIRAPGVHMSGRQPALISVEIQHDCDRVPGQVRGGVVLAGRDHESAAAAWNRRG